MKFWDPPPGNRGLPEASAGIRIDACAPWPNRKTLSPLCSGASGVQLMTVVSDSAADLRCDSLHRQ